MSKHAQPGTIGHVKVCPRPGAPLHEVLDLAQDCARQAQSVLLPDSITTEMEDDPDAPSGRARVYYFDMVRQLTVEAYESVNKWYA